MYVKGKSIAQEARGLELESREKTLHYREREQPTS
jgi:hypothetical protein